MIMIHRYCRTSTLHRSNFILLLQQQQQIFSTLSISTISTHSTTRSLITLLRQRISSNDIKWNFYVGSLRTPVHYYSTKHDNSTSTTTTATHTTKSSTSGQKSSDTGTTKGNWFNLYNSFKSKRVQRIMGDIIAVNGFTRSCIRSLLSKQEQRQRWNDNIRSIQNYLISKQMDQEFISILYNRRLYNNIRILSIIEKSMMIQEQQQQQQLYNVNVGEGPDGNTVDRRNFVLLSNSKQNSDENSNDIPIPSSQEALRIMKFATATYGDEMIRSTEINMGYTSSNSSSSYGTNSFNTFINSFMYNTDTTTANKERSKQHSARYMTDRVSKHCSIPENDIIHMDIDHDGDLNHSRHIIAVDHKHQCIVLAIRGTFTISEVITDLTGHSRLFCNNGMAHEGFAVTAERTWDVVCPILYDLLQQYKDYELIITGHSLGGAVASLINIMVHYDDEIRQQIQQRSKTTTTTTRVTGHGISQHGLRPIRCIVFASVPTYTKTMSNCINYIYDQDVVSFVSLYSVRHLLYRLRTIDEQSLSWYERNRFIYDVQYQQQLLPSLIQTIKNANEKYHNEYSRSTTTNNDDDDHVPALIVPACKNVWIKEVPLRTIRENNNNIVNSSSSSDTNYTYQKVRNDDHQNPNYYYNMKVCDSFAMTQMGILIEPNPNNSMLSDHLCGRYEDALTNL